MDPNMEPTPNTIPDPVPNPMDQLQGQVNNLATIVQQLVAHVQATPPAAPVVPEPVPEVPTANAYSGNSGKHLKKPPEYDGKDKGFCSTFLSHLNLYIFGNPSLFPNEQSKVTFAASYLRGQAFKWFEPHLLKPLDPLLHSFTLFQEELLRNLGDPDKERTVTRQIRSLTQTSSAAAYYSQFNSLAAYLHWNDDALRAQFYEGLKADVKDALALANIDPLTIEDLAALAIRLDNRLYERRMDGRKQPEKKTSSGNATSTSNNNRRPPPTTSRYTTETRTVQSGPTPMDLDATKNGKKFKPLTPQERQHRIANNLCLYCGHAGHRVGDCPTRAQNQKTGRVAATSTDNSEITVNLEHSKN
jgi:hypothetical protein